MNGTVARGILAMAVIAVFLGLAGCGEETARIEENQIQLQVMAKSNAQQIKALAAVIEQNQQELKAGFEALHTDIHSLDIHAIALGEEQAELKEKQDKLLASQAKLQEAVQTNTRQVTAKLAAIEQNHDTLLTGMEAVQNDAQKVAAGMASVADEQAKLYAGLTSVTEEQEKLQLTVQSNSRQLDDTSAAIEQNRQESLNVMGNLQENIQQVAANMNTLSSDLLKLQDVLQGNIRELVSLMDDSGQGQLEFQEQTRAGLVALDNSISAVKDSQSRLQSQIDNVQNSTDTLGREVPTVIGELKDEVSRISRELEESASNEPYISSEPEDI
jgi:chromosome segregation ATPase